jgi:putative flippase GtrA
MISGHGKDAWHDHPMARLASSQFARFIIVGGAAAAVNFASRIVINAWLSYAWSVALAYLVGMATAFVLNRMFVFKDAARAIHHQAFWFVVVNAVALVQTLVVSVGLAKWIFPKLGFHWHEETLAHMVGIIVPLASSYLGHKHVSFKS